MNVPSQIEAFTWLRSCPGPLSSPGPGVHKLPGLELSESPLGQLVSGKEAIFPLPHTTPPGSQIALGINFSLISEHYHFFKHKNNRDVHGAAILPSPFRMPLKLLHRSWKVIK